MRGIVVVRGLETDSAGRQVPSLPAAWRVNVEAARWYTVYPTSRPAPMLHARLMANNGAQGAFLVLGPDAALRQILQSSAIAWTLAGLRADTGAVAMTVKGAWIDDRRQEYDQDGDPLPRAQWSEPIVGVRGTMAGFDHRGSAESTGDLP